MSSDERKSNDPTDGIIIDLSVGTIKSTIYIFWCSFFHRSLICQVCSQNCKTLGCLFTCLTTRAVYLELVPSLQTDDFMILRQFISRKGPPVAMRSDRGTNFVGADKELREIVEDWNQAKIEQELQ